MKKKSENRFFQTEQVPKHLLRKMKLTVLLCFIGLLPLSASLLVAQKKVNLNMKNVSLQEVFNELRQQTGDIIVYHTADIDQYQKVNVNHKEKEVSEVLDQVLKSMDLGYKIVEDYIVIFKKEDPKPASEKTMRTVKGKVVDEKGEPVIGANVWIKETSIGVASDIKGFYTLTFSGNHQILVASYVGYKNVEKIMGDLSVIDFKLEPDSEGLEEVVVVGYGTQKRESVIGSISTVKIGDLKLPVGRLSTSLAGQMAGVVAYSRSGEPGESGSFYIRGISSFNGASQNPLVLVDGIERSLDAVDPEDIESFSVLKDATATAIYGVRGANGVMLITTRRGVIGKPEISVRAEYGITMPTRMPKMVNSLEFIEMVNEVRPNTYTPEVIDKYRNATPYEQNLYPNVNWIDELFAKFATNQRVNLNIAGGGDVVKYYVAGSFYNEGSIFKNDDNNNYKSSINFRVFNFRSNVDFSLSPSTKLGVSLANVYNIKNQPGAPKDDVFKGIWNTAFKTSPNAYPLFYTNPDGSFDRLAGQQDGQGWNPYNQLMRSGYDQSFNNKAQSNLNLTQDFSGFITEGLKAGIRFAWDAESYSYVIRNETPQTWLATGKQDANGLYQFMETTKGEESLGYNQGGGGTRSIYIEASAEYNRVFSEVHKVSGLFLYNQREHTMTQAGSPISAMAYKNQGLAGRLTYSFDDRYFAEGNFGYNGSENFSPGKRFGFFPSIALGWMVSGEKFWASMSDVVDVLKIRGSYGLVGNDQIGGNRRFIYEGTINSGQPGYNFGDQGQSGGSGIKEGDIANPNVGWEKAYKLNIGVELSVLNSLRIQADYFNEDRRGIFVQRAGLPEIAGNSTIPWSNVGEMNNKGFDSSLEFNRKFGEFFVSARGNFTYNKSTILNNDEPAWKNPYQGATGKKYGQPFGLICVGFFENDEDIRVSPQQQWGDVRPGDLKYLDINGDGTINDEDKVPIGHPDIPQISYGLGASVSWKGVDLSLFFQGIGKVSLFTEGNAIYGLTSTDIRANGMYRDLYNNRWQVGHDNSDAKYPRLSDGTNPNNNQRSTMRMEDGSFVRLKNAELGYSLSKSLLTKIRLKNVRIYVSGLNLLTFSKFKLWDPEKGSGQGQGYPPNKVVSFGLNMNF